MLFLSLLCLTLMRNINIFLNSSLFCPFFLLPCSSFPSCSLLTEVLSNSCLCLCVHMIHFSIFHLVLKSLASPYYIQRTQQEIAKFCFSFSKCIQKRLFNYLTTIILINTYHRSPLIHRTKRISFGMSVILFAWSAAKFPSSNMYLKELYKIIFILLLN